MKLLKLLMLMNAIVLVTACMKDGISVNIQTVGGGIVSTPTAILPAPPTNVVISAIPSSLTESAVFNLSPAQGATATEVRIFKKSDNSIVKDWETITPGTNVAGVTLDPSETYFAVFRSKNASGFSPEVTSPDWVPVYNFCTGAYLTNAPYASGAGTSASPYLICTTAQFEQLGVDTANWKSHFRLMEDIDLSSVSFNGIGNDVISFSGHFDGNGKTISNHTLVSADLSSIGLFRSAHKAFIHDLTILNSTISAVGANMVGALMGDCFQSHIKNISLMNTVVNGADYVGSVFGKEQDCTVIKVTASGSVTGNMFVGGIVGEGYGTTMLNVTSTVTVNGYSHIGGFAGQTYNGNYQKINVTAPVNGTAILGGLVGQMALDPKIYRSSYSGTITGTEEIGGLVGHSEGYCNLAMLKSDFTINGVRMLGGATGYYDLACLLENSFLQGTINSTAPGESIGGFYGLAYNAPSTRQSLGVVTINSTASKVGGFIGESTSMSAAAYNDYNAVVANVIGNDSLGFVSIFSGNIAGIFDDSTSYYWSSGTCDNVGPGSCNSDYGQQVPLLSTFHSKSSAPYTSWDFINVWQENAGAYPSLKIQSQATTKYSKPCSSHAFVGIPYVCTHVIDNSEGDKFEFQSIMYENDTTCGWLYSKLNSHLGSPALTDVGSCTNKFRITDGVNPNALDSFNVTVHDELRFSPNVSKGGLFLKYQPVNGGATTKTVTITNSRSSAIAITITPPSMSVYTRIGGTCGSSIPALGSCTFIVSFDPVFEGAYEDIFAITYTSSDGTFTIPYFVYGFGT